MSRRKCCCGCWHVEDNFNRSPIPVTDLGGNWKVISGIPEIRDNQLYMPNGNDFAVFEPISPYPRTVLLVNIFGNEGTSSDSEFDAMGDMEVGAIARIVVNYDENEEGDPYPYHYVDIEKTVGSYEVRLYVSNNPIPLLDEDLADYGDWQTPDDGFEIRVCFTDEAFVVNISSHPDGLGWTNYVKNPGYIQGRPRCGLANGGGTGVVRFDNLEYAVHATKTNEPDPDCPLCICWCNDHVLPKTLTATVDGWDELCWERWTGPDEPENYGLYGCSQSDGFSIEMEYDPIEGWWAGQEFFGPGETNLWHAIFKCQAGEQGCTVFSFEVWGDSDEAPICCCWDNLEASNCDPGVHEDQDTYPCQCDPFIWVSIDINNNPNPPGGYDCLECPLCNPLYDDPEDPMTNYGCGGMRIVVME